MITSAALVDNVSGIPWFERLYHDAAARWSEENWTFCFLEELSKMVRYLEEEPVLDIVSWDVTIPGSIAELEAHRAAFGQAFLMIIADKKVSPMKYLKPSVSPNSLLLKPFGETELKRVLDELVHLYMEKFRNNDHEAIFSVDTREGRQLLPFSAIYMFEARDKKIYVRTRREEYSYYDTIDSISERLPENFIRTHRSFIVNMDRVVKMQFQDGIIILENDDEIPVSRSFRKSVREYLNERTGKRNSADVRENR